MLSHGFRIPAFTQLRPDDACKYCYQTKKSIIRVLLQKIYWHEV